MVSIMENVISYATEVGTHSLPLWNELPDIELYMDQVISLMQKYLSPILISGDVLTPAMINNYVKQGVLPAPVKKRYTKEHIARLIVICLMKRQLPIPTVSKLMELQTSVLGIDGFYELFREMFISAACDGAKSIISTADTANCLMELAVTSAAHHAVTEGAFHLLLPDNDKK